LFGRGRQFEIAAVVTSPALDIAANYFNAGDMLMAQSVHVALGTFADARRVFQVPDEASLILFNFDLPATDPPAEFSEPTPIKAWDAARLAQMIGQWQSQLPERKVELSKMRQEIERIKRDDGYISWPLSPTLRVFREALVAILPLWPRLTPAQRWRGFREELVMRLIEREAGAGSAQHGSVRALKMRIDRDLRRATQLFAAIPMVALIVAALGVGNLMMANVASRLQQLATLRALGMTRWQVARLVMGEALALGVLGSAVGVALGLHAAGSINQMVEMLWGYRPIWTMPVGWISLGIGLTVLVCLVAGFIPARRAARSNVISALQTT